MRLFLTTNSSCDPYSKIRTEVGKIGGEFIEDNVLKISVAKTPELLEMLNKNGFSANLADTTAGNTDEVSFKIYQLQQPPKASTTLSMGR